MKRIIAPGTVGFNDRIFVRNTTFTTSIVGLTGLRSNSPGLTLYYIADGLPAPVAVPLVAGTLGAWISGGFAEVDPVNMPGDYQIGIPDAAIGSVWAVEFRLRGASAMEEVPWQYQVEGAVLYGETGSIPYTFTVYEADHVTPIQGVSVYVSRDPGGAERSQAKLTDALGKVLFNLDAGTVYFWLYRYDRTFPNPIAEVVG